mmetsp:Transcript_63566/g.113111  ORF Transcript_63566/g.113111 Transcript_63566/m.113111 type:complete len:351 (-) Transcript_63566:284-1336(-)|eukprot:CAMPEP_0197650516 /NCGR_PEP_ID=MMETSP1338-20131121/30990_1 /TAXON_ID=43686 ORGANISM="Pelagodinium beii, Strain RCC1491" /NCGR_SAMPLE_ID=MMETSP1338 /ASSEMBLY_ACC=CAM_ASM_000754 /LENGTH=350 /DNA_ID=CAMNT_0043224939 /DNA_START=70 /DNA_END=1122 /DNA_ORIENTATION=-
MPLPPISKEVHHEVVRCGGYSGRMIQDLKTHGRSTSSIDEQLGRTWMLLVGGFLDYLDLARAQCTQSFCPRVLKLLWEESAVRYLNSFPLWGKSAKNTVDRLLKTVDGIAMIRELYSLRQTLFTPSAWQPWICETSFRSVKAFGLLSETDENPYELRAASLQSMRERVPYQASIAVASGAFLGQPFVTGMRVTSLGAPDDAVCVGIEASGTLESGLIMSVLFAPYSGHVYIKHAENGPLMQAEVLPRVSKDSTCMNVWMEVTGEGGVRFLRQADGQALEETGVLDRKCFPRWVKMFFASIDFWCYDMQAKQLDVSVDWCGNAFPADLSVSAPCTEMDAVWTLNPHDDYVE